MAVSWERYFGAEVGAAVHHGVGYQLPAPPHVHLEAQCVRSYSTQLVAFPLRHLLLHLLEEDVPDSLTIV